MAKVKSKRSSPKAARQRTTLNRQVFRFPTVGGKKLKTVELSTYSAGHIIAVRFQDETSLEFSIDPGFTVKTHYADWKTGDQRVLKKWPLIRSAPGGV